MRVPRVWPAVRTMVVAVAAVASTAGAGPPAPEMVRFAVHGRTTNEVGWPIGGAVVRLLAASTPDDRVCSPVAGAEAISDKEGWYALIAPLPVHRVREGSRPRGTFRVYATAPGRGFAWSKQRIYVPQPRPFELEGAGTDRILFIEDPITADLALPPAAVASGRFVDGQGRPVEGVSVQLTYADYLDLGGKDRDSTVRGFWGLQRNPIALATTNRDGRFRFSGLPVETGFRVLADHSTTARMAFKVATTDRLDPARHSNPDFQGGPNSEPVFTGEVNLTLPSSRPVVLRAVRADTGAPVPNARLSAERVVDRAARKLVPHLRPGDSSPESVRIMGLGKTDADGRLVLRLPEGTYHVQATPPRDDPDLIPSGALLDMTGPPEKTPLDVRMNPGCRLMIEVVAAETGQGVRDIGIMEYRNGFMAPVYRPPSDHRDLWTDADGRLQAVVEPGGASYAVEGVPERAGFLPDFSRRALELPPGATVRLRFELRKAKLE